MDDPDRDLDAETQREIQAALDKGAMSAHDDGIRDMAVILRKHYRTYRYFGFSRRQSFAFTAMFYQAMLMRNG